MSALLHLARARSAMYAEGGEVHPDDVRRVRLFGNGGVNDEEGLSSSYAPETAAAAIAALLFRKNYKPLVNALTRAVPRARASVISPMESATSPDTRMFSKHRFDIAASQAGMNRPYSMGQGAWTDDVYGTMHNPLQMVDMGRTMGRVSGMTGAKRDVAQMGENMDQKLMAMSRFFPQTINDPRGADALLASGIGPAEIRALAAHFGGNAVVTHRPGNMAGIFALDNTGIEELLKSAHAAMPGLKARYAVSRPMVDRISLAPKKEDWIDYTYRQAGAIEPPSAFRNVFRAQRDSD